MHVYWGPPNTCRSAQNYLCDNPVVAKPLMLEHVKPRLLGHWGTTPGLHFITYIHLNRIIMAVPNNIDRFHLAKDVIDQVPSLGSRAAYLA